VEPHREAGRGAAPAEISAEATLAVPLPSEIPMSKQVPRTLVALLATCCLSQAALAQHGAPAPSAGATTPSLDPLNIPKYVSPLRIPKVMPKSTSDTSVDYQIAVRQFHQQVLPEGLPMTKVWGFGSKDHPSSFRYPAHTIEVTADVETRIKWLNELVDERGNYLSHIVPVDQTLHWADPGGLGCRHTMDHMSMSEECQKPYTGPVPFVTHLHGAHTTPESDGHPVAWWLPDANDIPAGYARRGGTFAQAEGAPDVQGQAIFRYPNTQPAATLWYHDHTVGMTRANVYAGPAGLYLIRGGPGDDVRDIRTNGRATLPGGKYEIPLVVQDRSFNTDGSLFYPTTRAFFDGYTGPYAPHTDIAPLLNPEFFGNAMVVNGKTWPYLEVEARRYRLRVLNASDSRFLILALDSGLPFTQIGGDGGFLREPVSLSRLLLGPAERADVIVDFSKVAPGTRIRMLNLGPDEPFGGGVPDVDFPAADPRTTGQVMQFRVVEARHEDRTTRPQHLALPAPAKLGKSSNVRRVSLNELDSQVVCSDADGMTGPCGAQYPLPFGPAMALLGTVDGDGNPVPHEFMEPVTDTVKLGDTETWEIFNFTADAHPIHIHLVQFEILNRQGLVTDAEGITAPPARLVGRPRPPERWESGRKDTLIVYPGEVARVKARFDLPGEYIWHCHILSHEDNEMMRPYVVQ
jgi:FtsP/CotA-like multicopper oxidase with cupredoxin domain